MHEKSRGEGRQGEEGELLVKTRDRIRMAKRSVEGSAQAEPSIGNAQPEINTLDLLCHSNFSDIHRSETVSPHAQWNSKSS